MPPPARVAWTPFAANVPAFALCYGLYGRRRCVRVCPRRPGAGAELGQPKDFAVGFLMGFFLGIIMLFWVWEVGPYRQKMGIMAGVSTQLALR